MTGMPHHQDLAVVNFFITRLRVELSHPSQVVYTRLDEIGQLSLTASYTHQQLA